MWYDQTPANYAKGLRWDADRNDERAAHHRTQNEPWSPGDVVFAMRAARRLRAMAILCDHSTEERAGGVDMLGMDRPEQTREDEDRAVATAEAMVNQPGSNGQ